MQAALTLTCTGTSFAHCTCRKVKHHNCRALVTGGSAGICLAMATALAGKGAAVAIAGRDLVKAEASAAALSGLGLEAVRLSADVADETSAAGRTRAQ